MSKDRTRNGPKPKPNKRAASVVGMMPAPKLNTLSSTITEMVGSGPYAPPPPIDPTSLHGLANHLSARCKELLVSKGDLSHNEKTYLFDKLEYMKDEKLKGIIIDLIGWGDDERAELETMFSVLLEVMRRATPEMIQSAAQMVEFRTLMNPPD